MPTYDYECDACGHKFELFQSISAPVEKKCPECGKLKLRRLFGTGAAIVFKGSGFYQTDYRSDSYKKAAEKRQAGERVEKRLKSPSRKANRRATPSRANRRSRPTAEEPRRRNRRRRTDGRRTYRISSSGSSSVCHAPELARRRRPVRASSDD